MKKILLALLVLSASAFGASDDTAGKKVFNFTFFGNQSGRYTMVACDYAEDVATEWFAKFDATDVEVQCSGGIQPYGTIQPLNLRILYNPAQVSTPTRTQNLVIDSGPFPGDSNCDFDTNLMRSLLREFPNVKAIKKSDACFQADSSYRYELQVTN